MDGSTWRSSGFVCVEQRACNRRWLHFPLERCGIQPASQPASASFHAGTSSFHGKHALATSLAFHSVAFATILYLSSLLFTVLRMLSLPTDVDVSHPAFPKPSKLSRELTAPRGWMWTTRRKVDDRNDVVRRVRHGVGVCGGHEGGKDTRVLQGIHGSGASHR